jgi:hypothetical protein
MQIGSVLPFESVTTLFTAHTLAALIHCLKCGGTFGGLLVWLLLCGAMLLLAAPASV